MEEEVEEEEEEEGDSETEANLQDLPTTKAVQAATTMDAKSRLSANLMLLNGPEWGHVVAVLEIESPNALLTTDIPGHLELNLDGMDAKVLAKISDYAEEKASARKRPWEEPYINDITGKKKRRK